MIFLASYSPKRIFQEIWVYQFYCRPLRAHHQNRRANPGGVSHIPYHIFVIYSIVVAAIWAISLPILGYYPGRLFGTEQLEKYLYYLIGFGIAVSVLVAGFEFFGSRRHAAKCVAPAVLVRDD